MSGSRLSRFERLGSGQAGGTKLCGRRVVNPNLSYEAGIDVAGFLRALHARLGEPDRFSRDDVSYSVRDTVTGVVFEAYSAQSGPSYGGSVEYHAGVEGKLLRDDVYEALAAFDAWIEAARVSA